MESLIAEIIKGPSKVGILPPMVVEEEFYLEPPTFVEQNKQIVFSDKKIACSVCKMAKTKCCFTSRKYGCERCRRLGKVCHWEPIYRTNLFPIIGKDNGNQCYRNSRCIRPYKHPGHCKVL